MRKLESDLGPFPSPDPSPPIYKMRMLDYMVPWALSAQNTCLCWDPAENRGHRLNPVRLRGNSRRVERKDERKKKKREAGERERERERKSISTSKMKTAFSTDFPNA